MQPGVGEGRIGHVGKCANPSDLWVSGMSCPGDISCWLASECLANDASISWDKHLLYIGYSTKLSEYS